MLEVYVGKNNLGQKIALPNSLRTGHVQIVGATGRGKTESVIVPWLLQDTIAERPSILIDGKGDRSILKRVKAAYRHVGLAPEKLAYLNLGDMDGSCVTNPLLYGNSEQIVDRIFSSFTFENEYFKSVAKEATLLVVRVLKASGQVVCFEAIYEVLQSDDLLSELLGKIPPWADRKVLERGAEKLLSQAKRERVEKFSGFLSQLSSLAIGAIARLVNASGEEKNFFSLTETLTPKDIPSAGQRKTVLILIPQLLYQESAAVLGKILLQEIAWAIGYREAASIGTFSSIYLDEFGSFVYPGFLGLLNKARSTNTAIHLSHQSLGDIESVSHEFAMALHTNTNVKCILGVNDPDTADFFAKHFGTRTVEKNTERVEKRGFWSNPERTGQMSVRDVEEYKIDPNNLRHYSNGVGVLSLIVDGYPIAEEIQFARAPYLGE